MITPSAHSLKDCRADFDELVVVSDEEYSSPFLGGNVIVYHGPEKSVVVAFHGHRRGLAERSAEEMAREIIDATGVEPGDHLVVSMHYRRPDGLIQALDTASGGSLKITLLVRREMSEEEKAVPRPDPVPPVAVTLLMGEKDFDRLCNTSMQWGRSWQEQAGRFENMTHAFDVEPSWDWKMVYWLGPEYSAVLLAGAFLRGQGYEFEVVWDMAENPDAQYAILTDFTNASWKQTEAQDAIREAQKDEQFRGLLES